MRDEGKGVREGVRKRVRENSASSAGTLFSKKGGLLQKPPLFLYSFIRGILDLQRRTSNIPVRTAFSDLKQENSVNDYLPYSLTLFLPFLP